MAIKKIALTAAAATPAPSRGHNPNEGKQLMLGHLAGSMIGSAVRGAAFGAGASAGARFTVQHTGPAVTTPVWQGSVGDTSLVLMSTRYHGQQSYALHVIADGKTHQAGAWWTYPEALAAVQSWTGYLQNGGTVAAWLQRSPQLAQVTGGAR